MTVEEIRSILERYYNGETSIEEEKALRDYFLKSEIPDEFKTDKILFMEMASMSSQEYSDDVLRMQKKLSEKIDIWDKKEKKHIIRSIFGYISAAAVITAVCTGITLYEKAEPSVPDTFDDPYEAYVETQKALKLFADAFNKGNKELQKVKTTTNKIEKKLDSTIPFK